VKLEWLGQFSFFVPTVPLTTPRPAEYAVKAYRTESPSGGNWLMMERYTRYYPDSNYVGAYFDELCSKGRMLGPTVTRKSLFSSTTRNFPVLIQMYHFNGSSWDVMKECRK
jgi:hypothetical protein